VVVAKIVRLVCTVVPVTARLPVCFVPLARIKTMMPKHRVCLAFLAPTWMNKAKLCSVNFVRNINTVRTRIMPRRVSIVQRDFPAVVEVRNVGVADLALMVTFLVVVAKVNFFFLLLETK
jgi:hypothetical protein